MSAKLQLLLFDLNETLLDLEPVRAAVNKAFNSTFAFKQWFGWLLHYSLVDTVIGNYHNFTEIGKATMRMVATDLGADIADNQITELVQLMQQLLPHPEVTAALELLKNAGFRMVTLTNSTAEVLQKQLDFAGLTSYFEQNFSVDNLKAYKPHAKTYLSVTEKLNISPQNSMLIAAHGWDIAGALAAGLQAAYVERPGQAIYPLAPAPNFIGKDLLAVAKCLRLSI